MATKKKHLQTARTAKPSPAAALEAEAAANKAKTAEEKDKLIARLQQANRNLAGVVAKYAAIFARCGAEMNDAIGLGKIG